VLFLWRDPPGGEARLGASGSASTSAKPAPSAVPPPATNIQASADAPPAMPPAGFGFVTVLYPGPGTVYVSGKKFGPTNERLQVTCGKNWFIRVASTTEGPYPEWLSPGESVLVPCQEAVTVQQAPGRPAPVKKKKR